MGNFRETIVVDSPLAYRMQRAAAARAGVVGREILTMPQLAARLAGGFLSMPGADMLYPAITAALQLGGFVDIQEVAALPGMPRAVADTLSQLWRADLDAGSYAADSPRLADIALLDRRVREMLARAWLVPPRCETPPSRE